MFINLSGTAVLDWCDGELFRCVKDRITGGEVVAVVLSPPVFHILSEISWVHRHRCVWSEGTSDGR